MATTENETPTPLETTQNIANVVVGLSIGYTVGSIVKNNATMATKSQKLRVVVATFFIAEAVHAACKDQVNEVATNAFNKVQEIRASRKQSTTDNSAA